MDEEEREKMFIKFLDKLYPTVTPYTGVLYPKLDESEHEYQGEIRPYIGSEHYAERLVLTRAGGKKIEGIISEKISFLYKHLLGIYEGANARIFYFLEPNGFGAQLIIQEADIGSISLRYNVEKKDIGDEPMKGDSGKKIKRLGEKYTLAHREVPLIRIALEVRSIDQQRLEKVMECLDDMVISDLYENNPEMFKEYLLGLDKEKQKNIIEKFISSDRSNTEMQEWVSRSLPELSKEVAMRVVEK